MGVGLGVGDGLGVGVGMGVLGTPEQARLTRLWSGLDFSIHKSTLEALLFRSGLAKIHSCFSEWKWQ